MMERFNFNDQRSIYFAKKAKNEIIDELNTTGSLSDMDDSEHEHMELNLKSGKGISAFDYDSVTLKSQSNEENASAKATIEFRNEKNTETNLSSPCSPKNVNDTSYEHYYPTESHSGSTDDENVDSSLMEGLACLITQSKDQKLSKPLSSFQTKRQWTKKRSTSPTTSSQSGSSSTFSLSLPLSLIKKIPSPRNNKAKHMSPLSTFDEKYKPLVSEEECAHNTVFGTDVFINNSTEGTEQQFKGFEVESHKESLSNNSNNADNSMLQSHSNEESKVILSNEKTHHISNNIGKDDDIPLQTDVSNSLSVSRSHSVPQFSTDEKDFSEKHDTSFPLPTQGVQGVQGVLTSNNAENAISSNNAFISPQPKPRVRIKGGPVDVDEGDFFDLDAHSYDIHSLAATYLKQKQYNDALEVFNKLLKSQIKQYGEINRKTASTWHNIGVVYSKYSSYITSITKKRNGDLADTIPELESNAITIAGLAINAFQHAVQINKEILGPQHPKVATSLVKLGFEQLNVESFNSALETFEEALHIRLEIFGKKHSLVAKVRNNLAITQIHLHQTEKAKEQLERAVEIQRFVLTDLYNDQNSLICHGEIAPAAPAPSSFNKSQSINKEESLHKQAMEARLEVANMQSNLGCLLLDSALNKKRNRKKKRREKLSIRDANTIDFIVLTDDGKVEESMFYNSIIQNLAEAEAALSEALSIRLSILGSNHIITKSSRKKFEVARTLLRKYIAKQQKMEPHASYEDSYFTSTEKCNEKIPPSFIERPKLNTPLILNSKNVDGEMDKGISDSFLPYKHIVGGIGDYCIRAITGFETVRNQIDELDILGRNCLPNGVGDKASEISKKAVFNVKTLEDDDHGYDSDDFSSEEIEVQDDFSDWLLNPENNIGALSAVASSLSQQKKYEKSLHVLHSIHECHLRSYGESHHLVGTCVYNMGVVHLRAGQFENAKSDFEKSITIRKEVLGTYHTDVAKCLVKAGITHLLLKEFSSSLECFDAALKIRQGVLGNSHPSVAWIYNNIGCVHIECNNLIDARSAYESALKVQRNALVNEPENRALSLGTATTLSNLGHLFAAMGLFDSGGIVFREAVLIQESTLGLNDCTVLSTVDGLANVCIGNNNYAGALRWYNTLFSRLRDYRPEQNFSTLKNLRRQVIVCYKISRIHLMQNDIESAIQRVKEGSQLILRVDTAERKVNDVCLEKLMTEELCKLENKIDTGGNEMFWL